MKHCHFMIVCNELPMLRQKVPFLYKHFDQLIFYDLNARTKDYSTDGSHEYLASYPDPEHKIRLCTSRRAEGKEGMFFFGTRHVRNDMDVFWCTDADEFFYPALVKRVEGAFRGTNSNSIQLRNVVLFHNDKWALSTRHHYTRWWLPYPRIARHTPGNVYKHCALAATHRPSLRLDDDPVRDTLYHFAEVGNARMRFRCSVHKSWRWYEKHWKSFDQARAQEVCRREGQYGYPDMHEAGTFGVEPNKHLMPPYIDVEQMLRELRAQRNVAVAQPPRKLWKMEHVVSPPDYQLKGNLGQ